MTDRRLGLISLASRTAVALANDLEETGRASGLAGVGFAGVQRFDDVHGQIDERRELGYFGAMKFTMARPEISCDPRATMKRAKTIVTTALNYWRPMPSKPGHAFGRVARYSWIDWYERLRRNLGAMSRVLGERGYLAEMFVDGNRLVDRGAAVRASIGHYGKNANVITPVAGSWVVIGSLLTDAPIPMSRQVADDCGDCVRCIKACPTGAIVDAGIIDARRCISYLLQSRGAIPREYRESIGDRLYGCDDCQECCPLNHRVTRNADSTGESVEGSGAWVDTRRVLGADDSELKARYGRFYMPGRDFDHLRRNALVVLGNSGERELVSVAAKFIRHRRPFLREHAAWGIGQLGGGEVRSLLQESLIDEPSEGVRAEIRLALDRCKS